LQDTINTNFLAFPDTETQQDRQLEYKKETYVLVLIQFGTSLLAGGKQN